ncbi:HNH endonuclease signature motif containing protein [Ornithinicoccus halotolerans]|uniref:HNH endonuclease signature motif containing protein n=1 Tax=Ornithinicoccus halotolerans TaxID=1748220 RepID=UPI00188610F3|nr:HNH endonuclease signature motif containing protein [Ornithinicoccus halotolerans]
MEEHEPPVSHGQQEPVPVAADEQLGSLREVADRLAEVADSRAVLWQAGEDELADVLAAGQQVRAAQERVLHGAVCEALARGMHAGLGLTAAEFVGVHCPWLPAAEQRRIARVAQAADRAAYWPVVEAVGRGDICTERADRLIRDVSRLRRYVDEAQCAEYAAMLLPLARMGADRELRIAVEHLLALVTPELDAEALAKARRESCKVFESSLADGMRRFIIEADPEGAALLRAVFSSGLTRPESDGSGADLRPAGRRRYDALTTVIRRGMASPDPSAPCGAPVQMLITLPFDVLAGRVGAYGTAELGAGELDSLTPGQARRLACEAELVPFVLGGPSEVLDQGRKRRLATPAQRRALWVRDRACTFPGCSMPAQWTEVHHARVWWSCGGNTDLGDMALLCRRHHTWVHTHDPEVTMTDRGPVWHLDRCHGRGTGEQATLHTDQPPGATQPVLDAFGLPRQTNGAQDGHRGDTGRSRGSEGGGTVTGRRQPTRARPAEGARLIRRDEPARDRPVTGPALTPGHHRPGPPGRHGAGRPSQRSDDESRLAGWTNRSSGQRHARRRRYHGPTLQPPTPGTGQARPPPEGRA